MPVPICNYIVLRLFEPVDDLVQTNSPHWSNICDIIIIIISDLAQSSPAE